MSKNSSKPNLIYIFADQLGLNHCGYAGNSKAKTPNIDRLARESVNFENAVSTMPVCSAYRASLLTGKYPTTTGMVINELRMNPNHKCFAHVVKKHGYFADYIGKWHLYANQLGNHHSSKNSFVPLGKHRLGFDDYWAAYNFHHEYYGSYYHENTPEKIFYGDGIYEPNAQTDMAIDLIRKRKASGKPFALFLSYGTPHDPWKQSNIPNKWLAKFKEEAFTKPPNYEDQNDPLADGWGKLSKTERKKLESWMRVYYAMVANLDWNLGRLLDALDEEGLSEKTIVVFTSDHGEMFGAHGRRAKNIFYEEAIRVPFLVRWKKAKVQPKTVRCCLGTVDIMPTLLSLMDLPVPNSVEGMDLSGTLLGKVERSEKLDGALLQNTGAVALWENGYEWRGWRDTEYTYATYRKKKNEVLFHNLEDPYQEQNLIDDPEFREKLHELRGKTFAKMEKIGDDFHKSSWYQKNWVVNRIITRPYLEEAPQPPSLFKKIVETISSRFMKFWWRINPF